MNALRHDIVRANGSVDPKNLHPLEILRRDQDWTYRRLADKIKSKTGCRRSQDCWRKIAQRETVPNDRTQHALDEFLESFEERPRVRAAR